MTQYSNESCRRDPGSGSSGDGAEVGLAGGGYDPSCAVNDNDDDLWLDNKLNPRAVTYTAS